MRKERQQEDSPSSGEVDGEDRADDGAEEDGIGWSYRAGEEDSEFGLGT